MKLNKIFQLGYLVIALFVYSLYPVKVAIAQHTNATKSSQSLTPPMGWNSWNHYACSGLNEDVIEKTASAMVSNGLKDAGYTYINLDDCWMASSRDSNGNLVPDSSKFPSGMPALVSYVHNLGLKFGLYEDVGTETCSGLPGSYGHYDQDAATFTTWGIDYIKMDWCNHTGLDPETQYTAFAKALTTANANVVLSICDWGVNQPWNWAPNVGNSWRTTPDIGDSWQSMVDNMQATSAYAFAAAPSAWNDPDMLEVGNGGMTDTEYKTHFSMWAMLAAPLILGNDLTSMSSTTLSTLTASEVIALDQDASGKQAVLLTANSKGQQIWSRQVSDGTVVALLNLDSSATTITANWSDLGIDAGKSSTVRDLWTKKDIGTYSDSFSTSVSAHGVVLVKINANANMPTQTVYEADTSTNTLGGDVVVQSNPGSWGQSLLDGNDVGYIGNSSANYATINNIKVDTAGTYHLLIYSSVSGTRSYNVSVNGGSSTSVSVTGGSYVVPTVVGLDVSLNAGNNTIEFSNSNAWAPDLDHIVVSEAGEKVSSFNIVYPTSGVTISASGGSANASLTLVPINGFTGKVAFTCTVPAAMAGASCVASDVTLDGQNNATAAITINTSANSSSYIHQYSFKSNQLNQPTMFTENKATNKSLPSKGKKARNFSWLCFLFPISTLIGFCSKRGHLTCKNLFLLNVLFLFVAAVMQITACGKASKSSSSQTSSCVSLTSAPQNLSATAVTSTSVALSWSSPTVDSSCSITSYTLNNSGSKTVLGNSTSTTVTNLTPAHSYTFSVAASDSYGTSAFSNPISVTTPTAGSTRSGTYDFAITATSGDVVREANVQVTVQ